MKIGWHGTAKENYDNIKINKFNASNNENEWLGTGVYLFVEGVNDPISNAQKWAIDSSWNNKNKIYKYNEYIVIKCPIQIDDENILDLTTNDGLKIYNYFRGQYETKLKENKLSLRGKYIDFFICNEIYSAINSIQAIVGNFYIKFGEERILRINSRIPNCRIMNLFDKNLIKYDELSIEKEGTIQ